MGYKYYKILILLLVVGGVHLPSLFANNQLRFQNIESEQGLSNSTIISIVQDKYDMLWFASYDGLNRYDGYSFQVYRHRKNDSHSILSDMLKVLYIDKNEELWIGSQEGLSHYCFESNDFENFIFPTVGDGNMPINAIIDYDDTHLLIGSDSGLVLFDKITKSFEEFYSIGNSKVSIRAIAEHGNKYLIGTDKGLFLYKRTEDYFTLANTELENITVQSILYLSHSNIWIGTEGDGLYSLDLVNGKIQNFKNNSKDPTTISSNYVRSLMLNEKNQIWIGTFNGLSILESNKGTFQNYYNNPIKRGSISQNSIRVIFKDSQGGVWLGTYYGGLNYYHPLKNQFGYIQQNPYIPSLNDKVMSCIAEDVSGNIWIGTNDNGINLYYPLTNRFQYINKQTSPYIKSNNIKALLMSKDNRTVFVGIHGGGLIKVDKKTLKGESVPIPSENVYALQYGNENDIWVGTLDGLFIYNEQTKEIRKLDTSYLTSDEVFCLFLDSRNRMWIGGNKSISVFSLNNQQFNLDIHKEYRKSGVSSNVNCIMEDSKKRIWIGTRGGLIEYNHNGGIFTSYTIEDGLSNNVIYGIIEDATENLWISTNQGLNSFSIHKKEFRAYSEEDGLPFEQFNNYSFLKSKDGLLYFGGINGLIYFYPQSLKENPYLAIPRIVKLSIANREVSPNDKTGVLTSNILQTRNIKLKPNQNNVSIEFAVTNYLAGKHNFFAYMLEGLDNDWTYTSENRIATYSYLKAGNYTFKLKAANNDGVWNDEITTLLIYVQPLWWKTWWAILIWISLISVGFIIFGRFLRQRNQLRNQLEINVLEKKKMAEVNQMKMRFFINVSHEFKTPLSLIISPVQEMLDKITDAWTIAQLKIVQKNAHKLLHLVSQLMDYRRAELGVFELKANYINPKKVINDAFMLFEKLARNKNIVYLQDYQLGDKEFLVDPNYLEMILSNLLSNAFKFTNNDGTVILRVEEDIDWLIVEVIDTGIGIPKDKLSMIFERFYQVQVTDKGTGIGLSLVKRLIELHHGKILIESEFGKGTKFSVLIPQNENLYYKDEIEYNRRKFVTKQNDINYLFEEKTDNKETKNADILKDKTILLAEDDEDVSLYLVERLSSEYKVVAVSDGQKALDVLENYEVDLVITDIMMDNVDGLKLCKAIKQNIQTCHLPVIILSAKSNVEDQLRGLKVGADDYLSKPFTFSVLNAKVQNMIKSRYIIKEHYSKSLDFEPEKVAFNELDKELLSKARKIVMNNIDNTNFSADMFSSEMGMSRSNLHLKLKAVTGESTIDFIRKIRFGEASKLLLDGRYNVAEVSAMVGFSTPSYFATSFKKYFGCLPTEYVKERGN